MDVTWSLHDRYMVVARALNERLHSTRLDRLVGYIGYIGPIGYNIGHTLSERLSSTNVTWTLNGRYMAVTP